MLRTFRRNRFDVFDAALDVEPTKYLVADASDLGIRPGEDFIGQIWNDSADAGILIQSDMYPQPFSWYLLEEKKNADGDITSWDFLPTDESLRRCPEMRGWCVRIYND